MKTLVKIALVMAGIAGASSCAYTKTSLANPRALTRRTVVEIDGYTYYTTYRAMAPTPDTIRRCAKEALASPSTK